MKKYILTVLFISSFAGCIDKPTSPDREGSAQLLVIDTSGYIEKDGATNSRILKNSEILFHSDDYNLTFKFMTNESGIVTGRNLIGSRYTISTNIQISDNISISGSKDINIFDYIKTLDTLFLKAYPSSPIIINEIYACGAKDKSKITTDVFIELYNNSDQVRYLDGLIICVCDPLSFRSTSLSIVDLGNNIIGVKVRSAMQFPGEPGGNKYPILPGQFVVVAGDAIDHRNTVKTSIDLSPNNPVFPENPVLQNSTTNKAQLWECYNQNSSDLDVPNVPNLTDIFVNTSQFNLNLTGEAVLLSSGKKGLIYAGRNKYMDLSTILDGVEYSDDANDSKLIDGRIDAGIGGVGVTAYCGKSIERIADSKNPKRHFDSNNSTFDFGINPAPTPGYQGNPK
jgi:hypothetical protein